MAPRVAGFASLRDAGLAPARGAGVEGLRGLTWIGCDGMIVERIFGSIDMRIHLALVTVVTALVFASCSDDGSSTETGDTSGGTTDQDTGREPRRGEDTGLEDAGQRRDRGVPQADYIQPDDVVGVDELGQPCDSDSECESGLCWSSDFANGCTIACRTMAECQEYMSQCQEIRQGVTACVPELEPPPETCGNNKGCLYPYYCQSEYDWCALPECTWDGDCPAGEECEQLARKCQPVTCAGTPECENPLELCRDGSCRPPECTDDSQCGARPQYCSPIQQRCITANPCGEEDSCAYSEVCEGGHCYANLCFTECETPGQLCNPDTGQCGASCTTNGNCPAEQACGTTSNICYPNEDPMADAVAVMGSNQLTAANVTVGSPVQLSGAGSIDPEEEPLTYEWVVNAVPADSSFSKGDALPQTSAELTFTPDVAGIFAIGLWVTDPGDLISIQAQVVLYAQ